MKQLYGVYAARHRDDEVRSASRSGGVFTAISDYIISKKGCVYGCVMADVFSACHVRAADSASRDEMRGSKYIQSDMRDTFREVKKDLEAGKPVLFSGTSCQADGLKHYLGKEYDNLILVDIVCHGVPSPKVWKSYLEWQEKKNRKEIVAVDFRNKTDFGWKQHIETLYTKDGMGINSGVFRNLFYGHNIIRPSCYECAYKSVFHPGDITIGDYWGIDRAAPGFDDNKGVSLVLINSEKGIRYFNSILPSLTVVPTDIKLSMQPPLQRPFPKPKERDIFWNDFRTKDFEYIARKYGGYQTKMQIRKNILLGYIRKIIRGA